MKAKEIMTYLETYFPLNKQLEWDRCGIQIGSEEKEVHKVMIALNADETSLDETIKENCDMLITHHPFFLEDVKHLSYDHPHGRFIKKAVEHDILVYSLHTCLDIGSQGISMNDWLIDAIGVSNKQSYDHYEVGKMGTLNQPVSVEALVAYLKDKFLLDSIKYTDSDKQIQTIAICGGSGADDLESLIGKVDCFITGDCKYRHAKMAIDHDIVLIDISHHAEKIMEEKVKELLLPYDLEILTLNSKDYFTYK